MYRQENVSIRLSMFECIEGNGLNVSDNLDNVSDNLDNVKDNLDNVEENLDNVRDNLDSVEENLDNVRDNLDDVEDDFYEIDDKNGGITQHRFHDWLNSFGLGVARSTDHLLRHPDQRLPDRPNRSARAADQRA